VIGIKAYVAGKRATTAGETRIALISIPTFTCRSNYQSQTSFYVALECGTHESLISCFLLSAFLVSPEARESRLEPKHTRFIFQDYKLQAWSFLKSRTYSWKQLLIGLSINNMHLILTRNRIILKKNL
jgi:hypothetical protein